MSPWRAARVELAQIARQIGFRAHSSPTFLTPTITRSLRRQNSTSTSAMRVGSSYQHQRHIETSPVLYQRKIRNSKQCPAHLVHHMSNTRDDDELEFALHLPNHELPVKAFRAGEDEQPRCTSCEELARQPGEPACIQYSQQIRWRMKSRQMLTGPVRRGRAQWRSPEVRRGATGRTFRRWGDDTWDRDPRRGGVLDRIGLHAAWSWCQKTSS